MPIAYNKETNVVTDEEGNKYQVGNSHNATVKPEQPTSIFATYNDLSPRHKQFTICGLGFVVFLFLYYGLIPILSNSTSASNQPMTGLLEGYVPLVGHANPNTNVYIQGEAGIDNDPPKLLFTIIDPIVKEDGETYMLVEYPSGEIDKKLRSAMVFSPNLYVRE